MMKSSSSSISYHGYHQTKIVIIVSVFFPIVFLTVFQSLHHAHNSTNLYQVTTMTYYIILTLRQKIILKFLMLLFYLQWKTAIN